MEYKKIELLSQEREKVFIYFPEDILKDFQTSPHY